MALKLRKKKCKQCGEWFTPYNSFQKSCMKTECLINQGKENREKENRKAKKTFKNSDKPYLKKIAQQVFNKYIRLRDQHLPCISCGFIGDRQWHAGHFMPQGGNAALRFNEDNCHKQCSVCNNHKSGNLAEYRKNLIVKIGLSRVEALENNRTTKSYTVDELKEIIDKYKAKGKEYE